jgi:predicted alpha/beta superfamily hydrolase
MDSIFAETSIFPNWKGFPMHPAFRFTVSLSAAALLLVPTAVSSQGAPSVSWRNSHTRTVTSSAAEPIDYEIVVSLPREYGASSDRYPVVYYLDAFYAAGGVEETYLWLRAFEDIPPLILVGVSWMTDVPGGLYNRSRDYTPTEDPAGHTDMLPVSGSGEAFLEFLTNDLIPHIERGYRTDDTSRGFLGYSLGGLFGTWVLINHPGIFDRYMVGSPYIRWDDWLVLKQEAEYAETHDYLNAKVYSCSGTEDFVLPDFNALKERLESREYRGLEFTAELFPDETHTSLIPGCYSRAFRRLYGRSDEGSN